MIATSAAASNVTYDAGAPWVLAPRLLGRESGFAARRAGTSRTRWAPAPGSGSEPGFGRDERHQAASSARGRANGPVGGAPQRRSGRNAGERAMKKPGAPTPDSFSLVSCVEVRRSSMSV